MYPLPKLSQTQTHRSLGTESVQGFETTIRGRTVVLFDTPGLSDTNRDDQEVLLDITSHLTEFYRSGAKLSAVLYLHPINNSRMEGSAVKGIEMLQYLCGDNFYSNVFLGTTFWDIVSLDVAARREEELIKTPKFWGHMIQGGSQYLRIPQSRADCLRIVQRMARLPVKKLLVQGEVVENGRSMKDTSASSIYQSNLQKKIANDLAKMEQVIQQNFEEEKEMLEGFELNLNFDIAKKDKEHKILLMQAKASLEEQANRDEKRIKQELKKEKNEWKKRKSELKKQFKEGKRAEDEARVIRAAEVVEESMRQNAQMTQTKESRASEIEELRSQSYYNALARARSRLGQIFCDCCDKKLRRNDGSGEYPNGEY